MSRWMRDLVQVQGGFKPSVQLPDDFYDEDLNRHFVDSFVPNEEILNIFKNIRDSLQASAEDRARVFAGTFGTGKSDLMLLLANYLTRTADDPLLAPFFERLRRIDHSKEGSIADSIYKARLNQPPFLLVLLQTEGANTFSSFVVNGLAESLEKKNKKHLLGKTYYQAAHDLIEEWEQDRPDNIKRLSDVLETDFGRSVKRIKSDLLGQRGDASFQVFCEAIDKAIGLPFEPSGVVKRPADAFVEVAQKLVESQEYSGVVVIADEFTHLLHKLAQTPGAADAKAIDSLAEKAVRSGKNQLHFYVVSLESFASISASSSLSKQTLERTGGRFKESSLRSHNTEELVASAIGKLARSDEFFRGAQAQLDDLLNTATMLWRKRSRSLPDQEWLLQTVVKGCFPLHPLTTFCLPSLNQVLAQNQRTMFSFIWDNEKGLNSFIATASAMPQDGWISLFTLERLFDYFEPSLAEKRPDLFLSYGEARKNLSDQQYYNGLEGKVLRAMVLLDVAGLRAEPELLRHAVGLLPALMPEISSVLSVLEKANVAYVTQAGSYQLVKMGGVNPYAVRRAIQEHALAITRPIDKLNINYAPLDIPADRYNASRGTSRKLAARFVSPATLDSSATISQQMEQNDGLLWYVVCGSEQELENARAKAIQITRQEPRLVVAVPRNPTDLVERLQYRLALEELRNTSEYSSGIYQDLMGDAGQIGRDYIDAFSQVRQSFEMPHNFEWYYGGKLVSITTQATVSLLAAKVMDDVFSATPAHKTAQHLKPSGKSTHLKSALDDKLLQAPFKIAIKARGKKAADEAILLDGAGELGLIQYERKEGAFDVYSVCPPSQAQRNSQKVWSLLEKSLRDNLPWDTIVAQFLKPPYGLYPSVLQLFLAAFYRYHQDYLEVFRASGIEGTPETVTASTIIELVEKPNNYVLRYQPLLDVERKFLRGLVERALYPGRTVPQRQGDTATLRNRVAGILRHWAGDNVPIFVRQATTEQLSAVLEDIPADIICAATDLMMVAMQPQESMTALLLIQELPAKLGLVPDRSAWSDQNLDQVFAKLESACQTLKTVGKALKRQIAGEIGVYFGLIEPSQDWNHTLAAALEWRRNSVSQVRLSDLSGAPYGRDLLSLLDDQPYSFEQVFLNALPQRWGYGVLDTWRDLETRDKYLTQLFQAKGEIEDRVPAVATPAALPKQSSKEQTSSEQADKNFAQDGSTSMRPSTTLVGVGESPKSSKDGETTLSVAPKRSDSSPPKASKSDDDGIVIAALQQITEIINKYPQKIQYALWEKLREIYDPQ